MEFKNRYLLDVLNDSKFRISDRNDNFYYILPDNEIINFKKIFKKLIDNKKMFISEDLKEYITNTVLKSNEINVNKINTYILIVYLTIHYNEFLSNENLWCASFYYDEIMHYKIHKKKIDLNFFEFNKIFPNILSLLIKDFRNLRNHYLFYDFFIYALKLGLSILLELDMDYFEETEIYENMRKNFSFNLYDNVFNELASMNEILIYPPSRKYKNYYENLEHVKNSI
jgi:hypothetical protein